MVDVTVSISTTNIDLTITEEEQVVDVVIETIETPVDVTVTPTMVAVSDPNIGIDGGIIM